MEIWSILKILRSSHLQSQVIKRVMGRRCKYRRSFACSLAAHLLLCGPVPNRLQTGILRFEDPYTNTCWGYRVCVCHAKLLQSCLTLCDPWAGVCQAPLSMGFSRQKILEWIAISFSRRSSSSRGWTRISYISCIVGGFFTTSMTWEAWNYRG